MKKRIFFFLATMLMASWAFAQTINVDFGANVNWYYDPEIKQYYFQLENADYEMQLLVTPKSDESIFGWYLLDEFNTSKTWLYDRNTSTYQYPASIGAMIGYDTEKGEVYAQITMKDTGDQMYKLDARRSLPTGALDTKTLKSPNLYIFNYDHAAHGYYDYQAYTSSGYYIRLLGYGADIAGTFKVGKDAHVVINDGMNDILMYTGSVTVTEKDGDYFLTGSFVGFDDKTYNLDLTRIKPEIPDYDVLYNAGYNMSDNVVMCIHFAYQAKPCNDVYFIGTFTNWELQTLYKFEPLAHYPGWYVAEAPYDNGVYKGMYTETAGYPVMADENGDLTTYEYSAGEVAAWTYLGGNSATPTAISTEASKLVYSSAGCFIYRLDYWKSHAQPCLKYMAPSCDYQLVLNDSYGDGWNGNMIQVDDGYFAERYTMESGDGKTKTIYVPYFGYTPTITWIKGSYSEECSFTIANSSGMGMYHMENCMDLQDGEVVYTFKLSPCVEGENPYNPTNITATLKDNNGLKVDWDKTEGAAHYRITIVGPDDKIVISNEKCFANNYTYPYALSLSGLYQFKVSSFDKDGLQLGASIAYRKIDLPIIDKAVINFMYTPDCGVSAPDGFWIMWGPAGKDEKEWTKAKMTTLDNKSYTVTIEPNAPAYGFYLMNEEDPESSTVRKSYSWDDVFNKQLCTEFGYYAESGNFSVYERACDEIKYHDYRIKNTSTSTNPGSVTFSWEADDQAEEYFLVIYEYDEVLDTKSSLTSVNVRGSKSYTWSVEDLYDGKKMKWAIMPSVPYSLPLVDAAGTWTLTKGTVSNTSFSATTADKKSIDADWTYSSTDLHYQVEVCQYGLPLKREIVTGTSYHYDAVSNGAYTIAVRPMTTSDVVCGTWTTSADIDLDACPDAVTYLAGTAGKDNITFNWTTSLPRTYYSIDYEANSIWKTLSWGETDQKSLTVPAAEDGVYYCHLEPMVEVEPGEYQRIGTYYETYVPFFTSTTYHVEVTASKGGYLTWGDVIGDYGDGFVINLSAYSESGYYFDKWSDGVTDYYRSLVVSSDTAIQALFAPYVKLTMTSTAGGNVAVESNWEAANYDVYSYKKGAIAKLTAEPETGYEFIQWSDGVKTFSRNITMDKDLAIEAQFAAVDPGKPQYTINVDPEDYTKGDVNSYGGTYYVGTVLELIATPKTGYDFDQWSDGSKNNPRTYTVTKDDYLIASFKQKMISLSVSAGEGGTVTPVGDFTYPYGEMVVVKAKANDDYHFVNWSDGSAMAERQLKLTENINLKANFALNDARTVVAAISFTGFEGFFKAGMTWNNDAKYQLYTRMVPGAGTGNWWGSTMQNLYKWDEGAMTYNQVPSSPGTVLTAGKYYYEVQIYIGGADGLAYRLPTTKEPDMIVTIDGNNWPYTNSDYSVEKTYSCDWIMSPEFTLSEATAVDNVQGGMVQCTKVLENGQLFILRDGKIYNAQGAEIK